MKKKILVMLLAGMISINLLGCSEKKDTGNKEEGNKPTVTEEQGSEKISEKELNEKFEKSKDELSKFFKENGFKERTFSSVKSGNNNHIEWSIDENSNNEDLYYTFALQNFEEKGYVNLRIQAFVKDEKFKSKDFNVNLDNSIILKAYEIFKGNTEFKYKEYGKKIQNKLMKNANGEELSYGIEEKFKDGPYEHLIFINSSTVNPVNDFMININYGKN